MMFVKIFATLALSACSIAHASQANLDQILTEEKLPALTAAKLVDGEFSVDTAGVRKWRGSTKATNNDKWHIGSNGKAITATLAAMLIEEKLLEWDSTIEDLFPEIQVHEKFRKITLKEIFAHRAGITTDLTKYKNGKFWEASRNLNSKDVRLMLAHSILSESPENDGSKLAYSNAGYLVAAAIMEKLTSLSWRQLVFEKVFQPLQMKSCGFGAPGSESLDPPSQPWPHEELLGVLKPVSPGLQKSDNPDFLGPAGTIHCSVQDWSKFVQVHLDGVNGQDTEILSVSGFYFLHKDFDGQGYTSGGFLYQEKDGDVLLGHNGSNNMNYAVVVIDPGNNSAFFSASNGGVKRGMAGAQKAMLSMGAPNICLGQFCLLGSEE